MNNNKKITLGFVLAAVSTILSAVCAFLYKSALMKDSRTYAFLAAAAAAGLLALILARTMGKEIPNLLLAAHAILLMAALGISIAPMVNEMGLVFAGLNPQTNLSGFITYAIAAGIAWLISVVASFAGVTGK